MPYSRATTEPCVIIPPTAVTNPTAAAQHMKQRPEAERLYKEGLELAIKHGQAPIALSIFAGLAELLMPAGEQQKAVRLLSIAANHPAAYYETKEKARKLLAHLRIDLVSDASLTIAAEHTLEWQSIAADCITQLAKTN